MAWLAGFEFYPDGLRQLVLPHSDMYGTSNASEMIGVVQLGLFKVAKIYGRQVMLWREIERALAVIGYLRKPLDIIQDVR